MVTLIVSDIFGHTANLEAFANELSGNTVICSPYESMQSVRQHRSENEVYTLFKNNVGHDAYKSKVKRAINENKPDLVIAFSAGASAAWRAIAEMSFKPQKLIGFYPGQIRNYLHVVPRCHVDLLFPQQESHFELTPVINILKKIPSIHCTRTRYNHGFMNALSSEFNKYAYLHYTHWCEQAIQTLQQPLVQESLEVS